MGADLLVSFVTIDKEKEPDWEAGLRHVAELALKRCDEWPQDDPQFWGGSFDPREEATQLRGQLEDLKRCFDECGSRQIVSFEICHKRVLLAGGMSGGDGPTESWEEINRLVAAGVTKACGFDF